jgi:hypothetical protein
MTDLGTINDRQVIYIKHDLATVWFNDFPKSNWLLFVITDRKLPEIFDEVIRRAIDNNVVYVCATGQQSEVFHNYCDEVITIRDVENEYLPEYCIMTTNHKDIEEEFWFAIKAAFGETVEISKIVCLDITTENNSDKLKDLIAKMKTGWMPADK